MRVLSHSLSLLPMKVAPALLLISLAFSSSVSAETKYTYDKLGRLVKVEYDNNQGTKYFYDAAGNRVSTVTDTKANIDQLTAPPKPINMINVPMGGMSLIIF